MGRKILALLYSISPWFYRWQGTQLPIEMTCGEAGSGKSTLYELRLMILTGIPILRNTPKDVRDWTASVAQTGGLHVTDNVHMTNAALRQELSDELCRIVTEPNPHIERRKLYSDVGLVRTPVRSVFAITAVKQPFTNGDIIQRSIITELDKGVEELSYDADWKQHQLDRFGGRAHWLAHQMLFQQRLFKIIREKWKNNYQAKFRLINVEQLLVLAAEAYGWDSSWVAKYLEKSRDDKLGVSDWALEAIIRWAEFIRANLTTEQLTKQWFGASDILAWTEGQDEYKDCQILSSSRMLGRYLKDNTNMIASIAGVAAAGIRANKETYKVKPLNKSG
jgi:hypothetical protein